MSVTSKCVFCGALATTRDHVPPQGVFPDPRPTDLITVPACDICNNSTKLDDEYFRWLVATGSTDDDEAKRLIKERILPRFQSHPALLNERCHSSGSLQRGRNLSREETCFSLRSKPDSDRHKQDCTRSLFPRNRFNTDSKFISQGVCPKPHLRGVI